MGPDRRAREHQSSSTERVRERSKADRPPLSTDPGGGFLPAGGKLIYTEPTELAKVRDALREQGIEVKEAELTFVPNTTIEVTDKDTAGKIMRLMDALDDCDDVTNTHVNFDIAEDLLQS